jgi:hypothetical protein
LNLSHFFDCHFAAQRRNLQLLLFVPDAARISFPLAS